MKKQSASSVGFILDGNRRWATERGLKKHEGHSAGLDNVWRCIEWCDEIGINDAIFYAFSTENWDRPKLEIVALMKLLEVMLKDQKEAILEKKVRIRFVGDLSLFSKKLQRLMSDIEQETIEHNRTLWFCVSYGGRAEILAAAKKLSGKRITEKSFEQALWTADMPEPELIIRTGGNQRLSNFLLWKAAYSELFFTKTKWPDFRKSHLVKILDSYQRNKQINKGR